MNLIRTHTCGHLRLSNVGETVTVCGWVDSYRDHGGGLLFIDLRDRYGKVQLVVAPDASPALRDLAQSCRSEYVLAAKGKVAARLEGKINPKLPTGEIEVQLSELTILNKCTNPPFQPGGTEMPGEDLRLEVSLSRPAPPGDARHPAFAASHYQGDARLL